MALPGGSLTALVDAAVQEPARASSTGRASRTTRRSSRGWPSATRCSATPPQMLRAVRDPRAARRRRCATRASRIRRTFAAAPDDRSGRWLRKPLRGGGGTRVRAWRGGALPAGAVVQERIDGRPVLGGGGRRRRGCGRARAHRAARRAARVRRPRLPLVREPRAAAPARGERAALLEQARAICSCLAAAFALRGLFGVDFDLGRRARVDARGQPASDGVARGVRGRARRGRLRRAPAGVRR